MRASMNIDGSVEQQDSKGWTPILWSSSNGYSKLVKQLVQRGANVHHMGQAKSGSGVTMALHECAAMRGDGKQEPDAYYETAWLLMGAGASPFMERSDGAIPIEVAAANGNIKMKTFLESCSLFRGTLSMSVPQTFGSKIKKRYCTVQPRFPFGNAAPTLWMVCYKTPADPLPCCRIPLSSARVMIEGPQDSDCGIIIIPGTGKSLKGVTIKSHTSNSFIIEIKAVGTQAAPAWRTLRTLADVCKAAAVAVSCRNLDQLCAAALRQATRQMRIPGADTLLSADPSAPVQPAPPNANPANQAPATPTAAAGAAKQAGSKEGGTQLQSLAPMTDSAEDMSPPTPSPPPPKMARAPPAEERQDTPRPMRPSESARRSSVSFGNLIKGSFGRRSSITGARSSKIPSSVLDSNSSLGQVSNASAAQSTPRKSGLWGGLKRTISTKSSASPVADRPTGEGLTQADLEALSQPIPDKFWSRIGRKMSTQRPGGYAPAGAVRQQWFHEDAGIAAAPGTPTAMQERPSFTKEEMNELMYPVAAAQAQQGQAIAVQSPVAPRRLSSSSERGGKRPPMAPQGQAIAVDNIQARAAANGTVPFILEEPIVPTQEMVPTGPRRSFSFDDLDDLVTGASRKARGHREEYAQHMAPTPVGSTKPPMAHAVDPRAMNRYTGARGLEAARPGTWQAGAAMPRRSFSFHNIDEMLQPAQPPPQSARTVQDELEAWRRAQGVAKAAATPRKKKGPAIDPFSHGGFVGEPAPEWRPYRAPSARPAQPVQRSSSMPGQPRPQAQQARSLQQMPSQLHPGRSATMSAQLPSHVQQQRQPQAQHVPPSLMQPQRLDSPAGQDAATSSSGVRQSGGADDAIPPELAHLASLRPLETGRLSIVSTGRGEQGTHLASQASQDLTGTEMYAQANMASTQGSLPITGSREAESVARSSGKSATSSQPSSPPAEPDAVSKAEPPRQSTQVSPSVPSVLFQGAKAPKIATPPQRVSNERRDSIPSTPAARAGRKRVSTTKST